MLEACGLSPGAGVDDGCGSIVLLAVGDAGGGFVGISVFVLLGSGVWVSAGFRVQVGERGMGVLEGVGLSAPAVSLTAGVLVGERQEVVSGELPALEMALSTRGVTAVVSGAMACGVVRWKCGEIAMGVWSRTFCSVREVGDADPEVPSAMYPHCVIHGRTIRDKTACLKSRKHLLFVDSILDENLRGLRFDSIITCRTGLL